MGWVSNEPSAPFLTLVLDVAFLVIAVAPDHGFREAPIMITILYDNRPHRADLATGWGFAAFVERGDDVVLFDTGGDGPTLTANAAALGVDLPRARAVVLSHPHRDHTGGLMALLERGSRPTVYVAPSFPEASRAPIRRVTRLVEAGPGEVVAPDMTSTGQVDGNVPEQGMVIGTARGLVILTGCAHPGVTAMVAAAKAVRGGPVDLVLGGFHLREKTVTAIDAVIDKLRELGVRRVAPTHCTGDEAIARFRLAYGPDFVEVGVGRFLRLTDSAADR
jgi:7,8-dihydropterin-6-yl-methyl-4-(beta-D-ribofuranosyl)aminobenzene 5'-phosphate synthase